MPSQVGVTTRKVGENFGARVGDSTSYDVNLAAPVP